MFLGSKSPSLPPTAKSKEDFKNSRASGLYQRFHPETGRLQEQGTFQQGVEIGIWKEIDPDGDEIHFQYTKERVGAICNDGSRSSATGRGACSWHGGVAEWLYETVKHRVGGTGKHVPIETRVQQLREKAKAKLKTNKSGLELEEEVFKRLLALLEEKEGFEKERKEGMEKLHLKEQEVRAANKNIELRDTEVKIAKDRVEKMRLEIDSLQKQLHQLQSASK